MIDAVIYKTPGGAYCGFKVSNHGSGIVCAAVSMLCINTVNSIEILTEARLEYCYNENGGFIECLLPDILSGNSAHEAELLLKSFSLGLEEVRRTYNASEKGGVRVVAECKASGASLNVKKDYIAYKR